MCKEAESFTEPLPSERSTSSLYGDVSVHLGGVHPSTRSVLKRLLDVIGGLLGLIVLAIIFFPVAIAIKLDSPGPIFYQQERCGLRGTRFVIRKFRSMVDNADDLRDLIENEAKGLIFKNQSDPRVTRVGSFLRKTSLDEFPQFWNVLMGDMSLVGTRPPTPNEVEHYSDRHWRRLDVKPGLTGLWQVSGRSKIKDFEKVVDLDLQYQSLWSPFYDLVLILKTLPALIFGIGAY